MNDHVYTIKVPLNRLTVPVNEVVVKSKVFCLACTIGPKEAVLRGNENALLSFVRLLGLGF